MQSAIACYTCCISCESVSRCVVRTTNLFYIYTRPWSEQIKNDYHCDLGFCCSSIDFHGHQSFTEVYCHIDRIMRICSVAHNSVCSCGRIFFCHCQNQLINAHAYLCYKCISEIYISVYASISDVFVLCVNVLCLY